MIDFELPIGWCELQSRDLTNDEKADIVDGPFGSNLKASEYVASGTPIARIQNVKRLNYIDKNIYYVSDEKAEELKRHSFKGGDILITKLGNPLGLACIAPQSIENGIIVADLVRFRPDNRVISTQYLNYLLNAEAVITQIAKHVKGTTRPRINLGVIRSLMLPVAPLAEQQQIVATLDELLAQVDTLKNRLDTIPKTIKRYRQSVIAAAVSGKLTEGWREINGYFNVEFQIEKILADRQNFLKKKPADHLIDEEYEIPSQWKWVSLDALSAKIVDGTHHTPKYVEHGVPFISVKDIQNGVIDFSDTRFISEEEHVELCKRCKVEKGDLLVTKSGTIGRTAIVNTDIDFSLFVSVALIKPASDYVNTKFIDIVLRKWINEIDISSRIVGSAIKNLHLVDMKVLAIPFPSIQEQTEIVNKVEQLFSYADQIEQRVKDAQSRVNHLTQTILAKAFRGELTAEWRDQNPELISGENSAEALLARIKEERKLLEHNKVASRRIIKKSGNSMKPKNILPIIEVLRAVGQPLSSQDLLAQAGYPSDASTEQLETFFLDIRQQLNEKAITRERRGDKEFFAIAG